jgi:hypothetical protein
VRRDSEGVRAQLGEACGEVMARLSAASTESYSRAYPSLVRLHMLQARPCTHHASPSNKPPLQIPALLLAPCSTAPILSACRKVLSS